MTTVNISSQPEELANDELLLQFVALIFASENRANEPYLDETLMRFRDEILNRMQVHP